MAARSSKILFVVIGSSLLGLAAVVYFGGSNDGVMIARYNTLAQDFSARTYPRPEAPPGALERSGSATEKYREVYDLYLETAGSDARTRLEDYLDSKWADASTGPSSDSGEGPGEVCLAMGVGPELDAVTKGLSDGVCATIEKLKGVRGLVADASQRGGPRSPIPLYDDWSCDRPHSTRNIKPLINASKIALLLARIDDSGHQSAIETIAAAARMGVDISKGSGLIGAMVGAVITRNALTELSARLVAPDLKLKDAELALAHILYLQKDRFDAKAAFEGEYLVMGTLAIKEALNAPCSAMAEAVSDLSFYDRYLLRDAARANDQFMEEYLASFDRGFADREALFERAQEASLRSFNPIRQIATPDMTAYEKRLVLVGLQTDMAALLAAARIHQLKHQRQAGNLEALEEILGSAVGEDPFVGGKPSAVVLGDGSLEITSNVFKKKGPDHLSGSFDRAVMEELQITLPLLAAPAPPPEPGSPPAAPMKPAAAP